jgi:hypothetical protein
MQPDAARRADTLAWLRKAEGDLRAATVDLGAEPPLVDDALFHCQQAVEKALKGFSEYAWKFRYPGEVDSPSIAEATEALALAREAHAAVLATLGERLF